MTRLLFNVHRRTIFAALGCAVLVLSFSLSAGPALADDDQDRRTISITAEGIVEAAPDIVEITAGVVSQANTATEALDENTAKMTKVVAAMKEAGIAAKDLQTTEFSVRPVYENKRDPDGHETQRQIRAYEVTNQVHLTLRVVEKLGSILDRLVRLGANSIDDISFGLDDPTAQKNEARKQAMQAAIAKAELYAEAAGATLGEVLTISENDFTPMPRGRAMRMEAAAAPAPIEGGTTAISIQLNVSWELE